MDKNSDRAVRPDEGHGRDVPERHRLQATCHIEQLTHLEETLRARVLGQDEAIESLVCSFSRLVSGLRDTGRPLLTALLMGPTGVGKTETAKALAQRSPSCWARRPAM
jgi:ATP-dependent Clp protease ATP-binding subunit ClpA